MEYPRFINNSPCGEDLFEGKSQQKIAINICEIIKNDDGCNLIGIDGGWGSGKSNLVKQIQKKLSPDGYHFFIYDAWGHQEDLQRRAFLEELTENLTQNNLLNETWKDKLKQLLSKTKETESKKVPKLSIGFIIIAIAVLITPIFKSLADKYTNCWISWIFLLLPIIVIVLPFIYYFFNEEEKKVKEKCKKAFTRLFLEYQNKFEEVIMYEMISEEEPSVRKFRNWMLEISKDIKNKKLIFVFDNMDRLPKKKVQELWSSIHVFFCDNPYENMKVIVPFDREHIQLAFKSENSDNKHYGDDFINKTFNVIYRVSPPILSDWKNYFTLQWYNAFGEEESLNENNVLQIFDLLNEEITPRKIIAFINEFVSIKLTVKNSIPNNYISLFILGKAAILKKPIDEILKPSYLKGLSYMYADDDQLYKYTAALFYQVEPDKAIQVVFTDRVKRALNENSVVDLDKISSIPEFYFILENAITEVSNYENAILALNAIPEERIGNKYHSQNIWNCLYKKTVSRPKSQISEFQLVLLSKINNQEEYLQKLLNDFILDPEFTSVNYFDSINAVNDKLNNTNQVFSALITKQTSVEDFINFVLKAKSDFTKYKIVTDPKKLNEYLIETGISKLKDIVFLPYLINEYSFNDFTLKLEELIKLHAPSNEKAVISILYDRYKEVSNDKPLKERLEDVNISTLFSNSLPEDDFYYDLIAMRISKLEKFDPSHTSQFESLLQNIDESYVTKISNKLEYYIEYGNLLLGLKTFSNPLVKEVAKTLTSHKDETSKANITKLVTNFQEIVELLKIEPKIILNRFEGWTSNYQREVTCDNIKSIASSYFINLAINESLSICSHSIAKVREYLNSLSVYAWKEAFNNVKSYEIEVSLILDYSYSTNAYEALQDILKGIADGSIAIPDKSIIERIINKLITQGRNLKATFNTVRDSIIRTGSMNVEKFNFFIEWLFFYADMDSNQSTLRTIFNADIIRDNDCLQIILNHKDKMLPIITAANEEAQDFKDIIKDILTNTDSDELKSFAGMIGVEIDKQQQSNKDVE